MRTGLWLIGLAFSFRCTLSNPLSLDPGWNVSAVESQVGPLPSHCWEFGTATEALLELYSPMLSVFGPNPFPAPAPDPQQVKALAYAQSKIVLGTGANVLGDGSGAVGDPASLGVYAWLLGKTNDTYKQAAVEQIQYLLEQAPRYQNESGAISQRVDVAELWADFMYMAPPFIAYFAADTSNETLLEESYKQCAYYREILQSQFIKNESYYGAWSHIVGPQSSDPGLWSTGNGWAAAGMTRVLAVIMKSFVGSPNPWRQLAIDDLTYWIREIIESAVALTPTSTPLLHNYLDDDDWFPEISGSCMLASVVYRMAVLRPEVFVEFIPWADNIRTELGSGEHITSTGIVSPAINPLDWGDWSPYVTGSPEGQAMVILMYAGWRDCVYAMVCTTSSVPDKRGMQKHRRERH
ncbi:hypothetical protein ARMGADRAFT_1053349 [Armillaria gallica]|uniref:Six-hairpin glycosidase n=1 Tax=Armillaria gallica TaxID=47427 RepID=A0A2H3DHZ0_ARMGA|nr:hypothetical protein ARMGADRAFT_1053349 [Armillaria gallica]